MLIDPAVHKVVVTNGQQNPRWSNSIETAQNMLAGDRTQRVRRWKILRGLKF